VLLNVKPSIFSVKNDGATEIPTVTSTTVSTWLMAKSGETVFIAGLIQDTGTKVRKGVPCLGFLPGMGFLFAQSVNSTRKRELLVLITPQVVESERRQMDADAVEKTRQLEERMHKKPSPIKDLLIGP